MTAKAKSPHTCHTPRSSRSLLAKSVWISIVPEALCVAFPDEDFLIPPGEPAAAAIQHFGEDT